MIQIPATSWRRLLAWSTDTFIFLIAAQLIVPIMHDIIIVHNWNYIPILCGSLFMVLQAFLYTPVMQHYGGTIGERLWSIKCVSSDNKPLKISTSLIRNSIIYWAIAIGFIINGSMLIYANIHNTEKADSELFQELNHPSMSTTDYVQKSTEWQNSWHNGYVYSEPLNTNIFLTWSFIGSLFVFGVSGLFNKENRTILDKITHVNVVKRNHGNNVTIQKESIPKKHTPRPKIKLKFPAIRIDKSIFTTKIAYMVYALLFVIAVLYFKYYFDVKREEKFFELKYQYQN